MGRYANVKLHVTDHAHEQYCGRVESIDADELRALCLEQLHSGDYGRNRNWFIHLAGVWWVYDLVLEDNAMVFITCYGRTSMDMPKALAWASMHHDRINLG